MFIFGRLSAELFVLVVVFNYVLVDAQDDSGQEAPNLFTPGLDVGKGVSHVIMRRSSEPIVSVLKRSTRTSEKCILLDFDAVLVIHDPQNFTKIKRTNISISSARLPDQYCPIEPLEKPRGISFMVSYAYTLEIVARKSTNGNNWYVDYFGVSYKSHLAFGHAKYGSQRELKTSQKEHFMETPLDRSYMCSSWWKILLYDNRSIPEGELHFNRIRLQVYNIQDDGKYLPEFLCASTNASNAAYVTITWLQMLVAVLLSPSLQLLNMPH